MEEQEGNLAGEPRAQCMQFQLQFPAGDRSAVFVHCRCSTLTHDGQAQASTGGDPGGGDGDGEQAVQADPYGCGGLWERFLVHWQPNTQVGPAQITSGV